jgi:hypothetical protein
MSIEYERSFRLSARSSLLGLARQTGLATAPGVVVGAQPRGWHPVGARCCVPRKTLRDFWGRSGAGRQSS